jgi:hypothetical protein
MFVLVYVVFAVVGNNVPRNNTIFMDVMLDSLKIYWLHLHFRGMLVHFLQCVCESLEMCMKNTGCLFYVATTVCHFLPLLCCTFGQAAEWGTLQ